MIEKLKFINSSLFEVRYNKILQENFNKSLEKWIMETNLNKSGDIEYPRYINKKHYRTDLEFIFNFNESENNKNFRIIIEYLENHHDSIDEYDRDKIRLYKIRKSDDEIKATWIVLEKNIKNFNDTVIENSEKLISLLVDLLDNEREFIIGHLNDL